MNVFSEKSAHMQQLHIEVAYYDEEEERKLLGFPTARMMNGLVANGCIVNIAQFLTYYLFHKKRPGKDGYRNYQELGIKIGKAIKELEDWVEFRDGSAFSFADVDRQDKAITERVGEAAALSVLSRIHSLHDADWEKIPEHPGRKGFKTFDYQHEDPQASDGQQLIQLEAKGSSVADTSIITNSIQQQKNRIDLKKTRIRASENDKKYPYPAGLRYGVISALGQKGRLRCWLVDPPPESSIDPRRHKLLARLQFMFEWISFLSPRSQLAASFASRLYALQAIQDPFVLDGFPLLRSNGKPFNILRYGFDDRVPSQFAHLCRVADGPAIGTLLKVNHKDLLFIGVQREIFEMAATQDFESIISFSSVGGSIVKNVHCVIPQGRADRMEFGGSLDNTQDSRGYVHFDATGLLHFAESHVVFGIVTR